MTSPSTEHNRGTAWRIWDLHIHTPASIVQNYGGDTDESWEKFIRDLEQLPSEISVIGINDYWFLDGYQRVLDAKTSGRLNNLDAIFPVIEMRLDHFGGTDGKLSKVNLHVIFDPNLETSLIQAQFIGALQPKLSLSPSHSHLNWQGIITKDSLADLGRKIKQSVPEDKLPEFGSDLTEGFNNITVSLEDVRAVLEGSYFKGKALIGIGKTEWRDIKWKDQSIASKKNIINSADFVFTAYHDATRWATDVQDLRSSNVTHKILDCSDAHHFSDSDQGMRIGQCQTWMNTTPTLAGLAYAIEEFERRVYVGLQPPALDRIRTNPGRFIQHVRITSDRDGHDLFDHDLPLNPGFVAVVGNKGQGKSALLDCIALGGNSSRYNEFAFLSPSRFLSPSNQKVAQEYTTKLTWADKSVREAPLTQSHDRAVPISVEYLPQSFVERVCNLDSENDPNEFEQELRTILFTHIPESERDGEKSFDNLLALKTQSSHDIVLNRRDELRAIVRDYVDATAFRFKNQKDEVLGRIKIKQSEIDAAQQSLAEAKAELAKIDSESTERGDLTGLRKKSEEIEKNRSSLLAQRSDNDHQQAQAKQRLASMEAIHHRVDAVRHDVAEINSDARKLLGEGNDPYLKLVEDNAHYRAWRQEIESKLKNLRAAREALDRDFELHDQERRKHAEALASADSARERARQRVLQSEERVAALIGDDSDEESHAGLKALLERIDETPGRLDELRNQIMEGSRRIHESLQAQLQTVESLYGPASAFIAASGVVKNAGLEFNAELRPLPSWKNVAAGLDGRRNGEFTDWLMALPQRLGDTSWEEIAGELKEALGRLERERGECEGGLRDPSTALRNSTTLEDFLMGMFSLTWLEVRFGLTGDGQPLSQLSPGQRGLVLTLFYLVVDRRTTPLLLDQPEENLDNETIASKLVPAIHEAAGRRQTIVVTHNANLAIVGDADQIVHCQMRERRFSVSSGSIAEIDVAKFALDVLEGTKPAFDNRRHKYEAFPSLR